jgi:hypothetical protein
VFKILLGLSALFLAGCGAFFSVKGIGLLFSGSFWSAVVMGSCLEFGKLMATSFIYRYWQKINNLMKMYLISAVVILMGITSLGIFGFLSQAFYSTKSNTDAIESQVSLLQGKKGSLKDQILLNSDRVKTLIDTRKNQENNLTKTLDQSTTTTVTKSGGLFSSDIQEKVIDKKSVELKSKTLDTMQSNISNLESNIYKINLNNEDLNKQINNIDDQIINLNKQIASSDIGTYKFIAQAFNLKTETIVKYFILVIVSVFDPFAVCLLLAYNVLSTKKDSNTLSKNEIKIVEKFIEKPINIVKESYHEYKRGTKRSHNPDLADPNIED